MRALLNLLLGDRCHLCNRRTRNLTAHYGPCSRLAVRRG